MFLGVRHHSPACARLVAHAIETLRPAYVLVEGPADMNDRLDELLLEHRLPVAVFSHYRDASRIATSWAPLCAYSPEWVALREGRARGAEVRFIDLPAWHPAFADHGVQYTNRYADAEARHAEATRRLCAHFAVDSVDALWDGLFEVTDPGDLSDRLAAYFDVVRGDAAADPGDQAREAYMASWVRAAVTEAGDRPVLVVTGGFHRPALRDAVEGAGRCAGGGDATVIVHSPGSGASPPEGPDAAAPGWPGVPAPVAGAVGGSYLVPYSFGQLDAFGGYQSGMPSPGYYQELWESGPEAAAQGLLRSVAGRLRSRGIVTSTADLIAARSLSQGLALLRGHPCETRIDVLDGLAGALIGDALEQPLPWTTRRPLGPGAHPIVAEMVAAGCGTAVGRLHPDTPLPPLVHDVAEQCARLNIPNPSGAPTGSGPAPAADLDLDLTVPGDLERSRVLHRLRILGIPGFARVSGPRDGTDASFTESWEPEAAHGREAALIEAGAYGARLEEAAPVALGERARAAGADAGPLSRVLFDAALCGAGPFCTDLLDSLAQQVEGIPELGALGDVLATALALWRHDRVFGLARGRLLGGVVGAATDRVFWLAEGLHGGTGVDFARLRALAAARDALLHAPELPTVTRESAVRAAGRISRDPRAPAHLRGAAFGLQWALGDTGAPTRTGASEAPRAGDRPEGAGTIGQSPEADGPRDTAATSRPKDTNRTHDTTATSRPKDTNRTHYTTATSRPGDTEGARDTTAAPPDRPGGTTAVRPPAGADLLGDWLAGLFALAREEVTHGDDALLDAVDAIVSAMTEDEFLVGLPALRQAFAFFPPRDRERIAERLLERRGLHGSARSLLRTTADPLQLARAKALEESVTRLLTRHGLGTETHR
ncbi:DUF5682 family protein [Streptomyces sp. YIM 130001]|uniref:DUF5682 family protein n=1 Tax=Streptomyces sp. YIM 130001 TaxID=2259644 RepID=UPI000E65A531|nr:DUF5682 family protein [Streptomyces sp. YIM 130001]